MSSSTLAAQNQAALDYFVQTQVSREMVSYLAQRATEVIRCDGPPQNPTGLPTPPTTPPTGQSSDPNLPPLEAFITSIIQQSHVQVPTLMPALVYLQRLGSKLPPVAQGIPSTVHRIFLASLILAAKNLNDSSPKNKHWARYTTVPGYPNFSFSNSEVNLMEKQLLYLMDWDLRITNDDLFFHLEPFLARIRVKQQQRAERKMREQAAQEAQRHHFRQTSQASLSYLSLPHILQHPNHRNVYDSPMSMALQSTESPAPSSYASARSRSGSMVPSSRGSSRAPSRTPSLSPPSRCDSSASYTSSVATPASSFNTTPASYPTRPQEAKVHVGPVGYYDEYNYGHGYMQHEVPEVVHVQSVGMQKALPPQPISAPTVPSMEADRPTRTIKKSVGSFVSRYLGAGGVAVS